MFPWVSVTNEVFSKCSFEGSLTSYLGIWQLCVMSCQRMRWQVMKNWVLWIPFLLFNFMSLLCRSGSWTRRELYSSVVTDQLTKCIPGLEETENHKVMKGMDHRGNNRVTDNDQVGSHKPFCFWEVCLSHRINDLGHWPHQNREHRLERNGWCHVRWRSVESQITKYKGLNLPQDKDAGGNSALMGCFVTC